jgi:hypothetical protein
MLSVSQFDPSATSGRISCCSSEAASPYQSTRLSRYNAPFGAQGAGMRRREFLGVLSGAAAWPVVARAQKPGMQLLGYIHPVSPGPNAHLFAIIRQALVDAGFVEATISQSSPASRKGTMNCYRNWHRNS